MWPEQGDDAVRFRRWPALAVGTSIANSDGLARKMGASLFD
jgi:hypothetical protein